jgi:GTP-binding protein LepA
VLEAIVAKIPPPTGDPRANLQALIFDAVYNDYRGVVVYVRVFQGTIRKTDMIRMMGTMSQHEVMEVGKLNPTCRPSTSCTRARSATSSPTSRSCRTS